MIMQHENFSKFPASLKSYVQAGVSEKLPTQTGRETPPSWQLSGGQSSPQRNNSGDGTRGGGSVAGRTVRTFPLNVEGTKSLDQEWI